MRALLDAHALIWAVDDPQRFDRLLVAQAQAEQVAVVSKDPTFDQYEIARIW